MGNGSAADAAAAAAAGAVKPGGASGLAATQAATGAVSSAPRLGVTFDTLADYYKKIGQNVIKSTDGCRVTVVDKDENKINVGNVQGFYYGHKYDQVMGVASENVHGFKYETIVGVQLIMNFIDLNIVVLGLETKTNIGLAVEITIAGQLTLTIAYERELNPKRHRAILREEEMLTVAYNNTKNFREEIATLNEDITKLQNVIKQRREEIDKLHTTVDRFESQLKTWKMVVDGRLELKAKTIEKKVKDVGLKLKSVAELVNGSSKVSVHKSKVTINNTVVVILT